MTAGTGESGALSVIDRSRVISDSLRQMARVSRFAEVKAVVTAPYASRPRRRRDFVGPSLVVALFVIPVAVGVLYFGFLASDRFVTEASFALRPAVEGPPDSTDKSGDTAVSSVSASMVAQDTKIIGEYILSRPMVEALERQLPLRAMFSRGAIDYPSRLDPERPIEKVLKYWGDRVSVSTSSDSQIVTVAVNAFSAEESLALSKAILAESERMINEFSLRARSKSLEETQRSLARAEEQMTKVRFAQRDLRNKEGVLDGDRTAAATTKMVGDLKTQRFQLAMRQSTIARDLAPTSRSMQELTTQIRQLDDTVAQLERAATKQTAQDDGRAFSDTLGRFEALDTERRNAEKYYFGAIAAHERAQIIADRQIEFFSPVAEPVLATSPLLPRRFLSSAIVVSVCGLLLIGVLFSRRLVTE